MSVRKFGHLADGVHPRIGPPRCQHVDGVPLHPREAVCITPWTVLPCSGAAIPGNPCRRTRGEPDVAFRHCTCAPAYEASADSTVPARLQPLDLAPICSYTSLALSRIAVGRFLDERPTPKDLGHHAPRVLQAGDAASSRHPP